MNCVNQDIQEQVQELARELMALPIKIQVLHSGSSPESRRKIYPPVIFIHVPAGKVVSASLSDDKPFGYTANLWIKDGNDLIEIEINESGLTIAPLTKSKHKYVRLSLPLKVNELTYEARDSEFKVVFEIKR